MTLTILALIKYSFLWWVCVVIAVVLGVAIIGGFIIAMLSSVNDDVTGSFS